MASSISESSPLVDTLYAEDYEEAVASSCCGCFQGFCCRPRRGSSNNGMEGNAMLKQEEAVIKDGWLVEKVKKVKEISEVLAGPKWKNFIRSFSNYNKKRSRMQYQYDLQSYALNFDEGFDREVDAEYPDFSARYAAQVRISKGDLAHDTAVFQP
ncbi:STRESS INDUCED PROTEIN [Salix viminalis]|nr:STRESS INDUCED PROTEIN [Salix viminalis]